VRIASRMFLERLPRLRRRPLFGALFHHARLIGLFIGTRKNTNIDLSRDELVYRLLGQMGKPTGSPVVVVVLVLSLKQTAFRFQFVLSSSSLLSANKDTFNSRR
jgi:hypothetical protein